MNALHKLAGVQETSDNTPSPRAPIPQPPPIPRDSIDDSDARSQRRASLPLNRKPSHKSFRSHRSKHSNASRRGSQDGSALPSDYPPTPKRPRQHNNGDRAQPHQPESHLDDESEDFAWGPSHPCFPHPNPHCAPNSQEFATTRIIRVKRDYLAAGDLYPQFANLYPEILDPLVTDEEFRRLIGLLNAALERAFSPYTTRAWVDSLVGVFTGYLWEDLGLTGAKRGEKEIEVFVDRWNQERRGEGRDVRLVHGRRSGFMSLDFVVPDPGIDMPKDEEEGEQFIEAAGELPREG